MMSVKSHRIFLKSASNGSIRSKLVSGNALKFRSPLSKLGQKIYSVNIAM